ncbi:MAG TPA: amidohydrolase family protein, partial [Candidatus Cloacimonadota bacterium]|nr:amidohydrolase family protein [Candidatus Cloacimonadota bacterium]
MILMVGGHFYQDNGFDNGIKAVLVEDGKIAALLDEIPDDVGQYDVVDLKGAWVYPGFIDTHTHSFEGG